MWGKWPYSHCFVECYLARSIHVQFLSSFFSILFVSVYVVHPYGSIDTTTAIFIYIQLFVIFINKECSIVLTEHVYILMLGDCQYLTDAVIKPRLLIWWSQRPNNNNLQALIQFKLTYTRMSHKFCNILVKWSTNLAALDVLAEVMKVMNHTGLWDVKLGWYSSNATHWICRKVWIQQFNFQ